MSKIDDHVKLNEAYSVLLNLALKYGLKPYYERLVEDRSFLSAMVNQGPKD